MIESIPVSYLTGKRVLVIGNSKKGVISIEIASKNEISHLTGVDLDPDVIRGCYSNLDYVWSQRSPLSNLIESTADNQDQDSNPHYFPSSLPQMFGYLPRPPKSEVTTYRPAGESTRAKGKKAKLMPEEVVSFPRNLNFRVEDWSQKFDREGRDSREEIEGYHVILAISVIKSIHLRSNNDGLLDFFARAFQALCPGGILFITPKTFSAYDSIKLSPAMNLNHQRLLAEGGWNGSDLEKVLLKEIGFEKMISFGDGGQVQGYFKADGYSG